MNKQAILHIQDSQYAYALNAHTIQVTLRTAAGDSFERVGIIYGNKYDYYIRQKRAPLEKRFSDGTFDYYTAKIKVRDVRFVYIFGESILFFGGRRNGDLRLPPRLLQLLSVSLYQQRGHHGRRRMDETRLLL